MSYQHARGNLWIGHPPPAGRPVVAVPLETDVAGTVAGLSWPLANPHQGKARRAVISTSSSSSSTSSDSGTSSAASTTSDPNGRPISVLIADDQRLVRAGFRVILASEPGIEVVGEAADGLQAIELARTLSPAVVLMDIRMPNMDGLAAARRIIDDGASRVLILTTFDADEYVYETLKMGASGFLLKDAPPDQLIAAVRCSAAGDALIDPSITRRLIGRFAHAARPAALQPAQLKELTQRELDVLRLVARGLTNAEIAADLVVEESTVKTHVSRILMKLSLRDRVQAVVVAYESGFVRPDAP